ncbi:Von Willebrand factor type A domain protein [Shewanella piezotolerans WP3]|uniref:von Willebrand factor type A domain protein n=1 Tax=Shewanella piezotolerans (strain WP3 / JCM 13877) TaxID=225849 RepID=B8CM90_SHEPW|nr:VWA domain-containing protein [Shewanella piezotolerans]ACJ29147.1 Von Willebrand factor type A domain protein [Shewanella piezotolerans WP3]
MLEFNYPLWALVLPLPWLINYFLPAFKVKQAAIRVPFFNTIVALLRSAPNSALQYLKPSRWQQCALFIVWLLLVTAMTQPVILGEPQTRLQIGRDLMVVVDLSGSMDTKDFTLHVKQQTADGIANSSGTEISDEYISRLDAVKRVLHEFAEQRQGDRLGLILFGDAAYLQAPFTADLASWLRLLDESRVAMAGQSTHVGDALGLAIKVMSSDEIKSSQKNKVVLLLTDGNDTDSSVPPLEAAKIAAKKGIRVHVIAIGDPQTVGEQAMDMEVIEGVAALTGGKAFKAISTQELNKVYQTISKLEPAKFASFTYQPKKSVHYLPIAAALVIYLVTYIMVFVLRRFNVNKPSESDSEIEGKA